MPRRRQWLPPTYVDRGVPRQLMEAATSARDRALIAVLYYCGLRASEAVRLDVADVDLRRLVLRLRWWKGWRGEREPRELPISDPLARELSRYLPTLRPQAGPLFRGRQRGRAGDYRITYHTVWEAVKRAADAAGLDPGLLHPHLLRHAFVSHLLEAGVPLHEVRDAARHANIATTSIYAQANPNRLRPAVNRLGDGA